MTPTAHARLRHRSARIAAALSALLLASLLPVPAALGGVPGVTELFFSEYIEGSSNNKALEIYNGTGAAVNLGTNGYNVQMHFNGNPAAGLTINLSGTVADDDVFVLAQSSANLTILSQADQTSGAGWFNGDDAVVLRKGTTVIDVIGQIGFDPGTEWGTGLTSTADNTLRRKTAILSGDANGADVFDPAVEWDGFAQDTFGALGAHPASDVAPVVGLTVPANGAAGVARNANIGILFAEPVAVAADGSWFDITCASSGAHSASASGGPGTFTLDPATDFGVNELCTATVFAAGVTDLDTDDPPDNMAANASFSFTTIDDSVCGDPATFIHDAQGSGAATPLSGSIAIEGIVVGDFQGSGQFGGYFVQEEDADADADPATSEGIFVFNTSFPVSLGDAVRVRGTIGEFSGQTQLSSVTAVLPCSSGNAMPAAADVDFPVAAIADLEAFESMRVSIDQELTVTEVFTLARFGEVALSVAGRLANPTNVVEPGAPALALQDLNNRSRILLDDGNNQQNIDPTFYPQGGLSATNTLRVGDTLPSLAGVLDFRFGVYRVQPPDASVIEFDHENPRPLAPEPVGGNLQVAAFNVLNFFNGDGMGGGFPTPRGANTPAELARQTQKIVSAMIALDADVYAMSELENDAAGELSAIDDLADALNTVAGAGTFDYIDTGIIGTDAIKVGILYKTAVVSPVGAHAILTSAVDPRFVDTLSRPALAQTFEMAGGGGRLTIVANHLKSKGSACPEDIPTPVIDGQQNCNVTRTNAARALVDWAASDPTGSGDRDVLMIGDLNSYAKEDPIVVFEEAGYTNEIARFLGDEAYSFVFQGQSGYLDHALTSATLTSQVTGVSEWHINADEPVALDYNVEFKTSNHVTTLFDPGPYRSSDHDPVLIGIQVADRDAVGLLPPIGNGATAKAGQVLPIQFSLGGDEGLDVLFETPQVFLCAAYPLGSSMNAQSAGASGLSFDPLLERYTFAWKTLKSWADSCRTIEVTFDDGSYIRANVAFTT
ncbi:MAG: ExeM/NucH family extracellular endonuclease [Chloroflexi bacterium]|nr:ExeM/NucH family extracellular endonuclease [Chloroflexota bacterium]